MADKKPVQKDEKAVRIRRKPEREGPLTPTFSAERYPTSSDKRHGFSSPAFNGEYKDEDPALAQTGLNRPMVSDFSAIPVRSSSASSNPSLPIQRYETSAGFFANKVTFKLIAHNATLAQPLDIVPTGTDVEIGSQDYDATGTVEATGPKGRVKEFEVGFLQTVFDSRRTAFYEPDAYSPGILQQIGTAVAPGIFGDRLKITDLCDPLPVRDGDTGVVPWYGTETVKAFDEAASSTKTATMFDKPSTTFNWVESVGGKDQHLVKTRGQDSFRSWVSVQEKGTTGFFGMHRLAYIDWKVDYGTDITFNKAAPGSSVVTPTATSGGKITSISEGPGILLPLMSDPTANDAATNVRENW